MTASTASYQSMGAAVAKKARKKFTWFDGLNYLILIILALICLYPVLYEFILSFCKPIDFSNSKGLIPIPYNGLSIENYKALFGLGEIGPAFLMSLLITITGTVYSMVLTMFGAYAFTKKKVPGLKFMFTLILITMFFSGGMIPFFLTVKNLLTINNWWCLVIPFGINAFNLIIMKNFFNQIPTELVECAELEGASEFRILFQIVFPLAKAGIATVMLWYIISYWDAWYWASMFLIGSSELRPLALVIRSYLVEGISSGGAGGGSPLDGSLLFKEGTQAAGIMISILPILCFYPFIQKYFAKGTMAGAVKG